MKSNFSIITILGLICFLWACKPSSPKQAPIMEVLLKDLTYEKVNGVNTAMYQGKAFSGAAVSKLKSGKNFTFDTYVNGVKDGLYVTYYSNGNKQKEGYTKNGKEDGIYYDYYQTGKVQREHHFDMGKKVGIWKSFYEDGKKWTERHFKNDNLHGKVLVWDEQGRLGKEYDYVNGQLVNKQMHFENFPENK